MDVAKLRLRSGFALQQFQRSGDLRIFSALTQELNYALQQFEALFSATVSLVREV
jgi:hypothetical protein